MTIRNITQIINSENGMRDINTDPTNIKIIIREQQFYASKFDNLYKVDKLPDRQKLLKLTQEETENIC